jgi:T-complex protein 1 subunit zeta
VNNALDDGCVVPGAGAYEVAVHLALRKGLSTLKGKARLGLQAYADGMLVIPKTLSQNSGKKLVLICGGLLWKRLMEDSRFT